MPIIRNRRDFLASASMAATASVLGARASLADEGTLETTTVRLPKYFPASCEIPEYVADELLRAEGFTDIRLVEGKSGDTSEWIARGELDFDWNYAAIHITSIEAGVPIIVLAGMHSGCLELIANDKIHGIADLKGKKVGVYGFGSSPHVLVSLMAAYVGLDLRPVISSGSRAAMRRRNCSSTARSTPSSAYRPSRRSCAPGVSATRS